MNTTLTRFTEAELRTALAEGMHAFTTVVRDRFGDYGLVGVALMRERGEELLVTGLMLSCRALGRGVEHRMLAHVGEIAERLGKQGVRIQAIKGPRNQPATDLLSSTVGLSLIAEASDSATILCTPVQLKRLSIDPTIAGSEPAIAIAAEISHVASSGSRVEGLDYQRIALELNTAAKIEQSIKDRRVTGNAAKRIILRPPDTETERKLAAIWCDLLGVGAAGTDEDFFDLGGHSLLAVQLLSRIQRDLGLELPDRVIYAERLTIANLARTIELAELGIEHHEDYVAALAEIEALTDDEVEALLAQEEAGQRGA